MSHLVGPSGIPPRHNSQIDSSQQKYLQFNLTDNVKLNAEFLIRLNNEYSVFFIPSTYFRSKHGWENFHRNATF